MAKRIEESVTVNFTANPTQKDFIQSRAQADLFDSRKP